MPEQRLQRCRAAYETQAAFRLRQITDRERENQRRTNDQMVSAAYRITQAQLAAEQRMVGQALKDLQSYAGRSSREPI